MIVLLHSRVLKGHGLTHIESTVCYGLCGSLSHKHDVPSTRTVEIVVWDGGPKLEVTKVEPAKNSSGTIVVNAENGHGTSIG